jgi:hypothetical protein
MKRVLLVFLVTFLISKLCLSQDIITLKTGEQIHSKILEVGQTEIKYKKFDNQNGPVYVAVKSDIMKIQYENGSIDTFNSVQNNPDISGANQASDKPVKDKEVTPSPVNIKKSRFTVGFSGVFPTGVWPATALSNMGSTSFQKSQGHTVKSYGFGVMI